MGAAVRQWGGGWVREEYEEARERGGGSIVKIFRQYNPVVSLPGKAYRLPVRTMRRRRR